MYLFQSLGNHELDNGVSGLTPFIKNLTCPVLAANLILTAEPDLEAEENLMKSVIININGTKIGIIGYLTPDTKFLAQRNKIEYNEEVAAIKQEVEYLKKNGTNILIALGHSGFTKDIEIAKDVDGIDIVIGGHTNTFLWNGASPDLENQEGPYPTVVKQASGRTVAVVQAYAYTKYIGKLYLMFDSQGEMIKYDGNPILLDKSVPQDPDLLSIIDHYMGDIMKISEIVAGNTSVILDGDACRIKECNIGNLIADSVIYKYAKDYKGNGWTDAPIAIIQGGGIRASVAHIKLPANITRGDLLSVMPFGGKIVKLNVNGTVILSMFEHAVAHYNTQRPPGQFLQVSGLKIIYNLKNPPGKRVTSISTLCGLCKIPTYSGLNESATYNILIPAFLSTGGDGFSFLSDIPSIPLSYDELDSTSTYLQEYSPVYPAVEGRIVFTNTEQLLYNSESRKAISLWLFILTLICANYKFTSL